MTRRDRLDAAAARHGVAIERARLDGKLAPAPHVTDREIALTLLAALGVDPDTFRTGVDQIRLVDRHDAYLAEFALCRAGDMQPADDEERAELDAVSNYRRNS